MPNWRVLLSYLVLPVGLALVPPTPGRPALKWKPPALTNPTTVQLCDCNLSGGIIIVNLAPGQDYVLKDSVVLHHPVEIVGGRSVVWIGGEVRPDQEGFAVKLQGVGVGGGTVHLEGLLLDGNINDGVVGGEYANRYKPSGTLADAVLQVENVRVGPLSGDSRQNHQDCIQHYGGWKDLRVDRLTCTTPYQGFYLPWEDPAANNQGVLSHFDLRHANLYDSPPNGASFQTLIHFGDRNGSFSATTHQQRGHLGNVYLDARERTFDYETYPNSGTSSSDGTVVHSTVNPDGTITWADTWAIAGHVTPGIPPGGDYVLGAAVGIGYG